MNMTMTRNPIGTFNLEFDLISQATLIMAPYFLNTIRLVWNVVSETTIYLEPIPGLPSHHHHRDVDRLV